MAHSIGSNQFATSGCRDILEVLVNTAYNRAKVWAGAVIGLQIFVFLAGVVAVFVPELTLAYPWIALPLALVGAWLSSQASRFKGMAETGRRQHELLAGFGVEPSRGQLADLRVSLPKGLPAETDKLLRQGITFSSSKPPGPVRVLENLSESAWFTKHLAEWCGLLLGAVFVGSLTVAVSLLLLSATTLAGKPVGIAAAKCVAATLLFLISVGTLRSWMAYRRLRQRADDSDAEATRLLTSKTPDSFEAQRLLAEYQLARALAPLIPTWVWRVRLDTLNRNWELKRPLD